MNTDTIKIFDANNELTQDFDQVVDEVLKEVHGNNYFDIDEEFIVPEKTVVKELEKKLHLKILFRYYSLFLFLLLLH